MAFEIPPAVIDSLHSARYIVVLTGAGISAESGVPTFREAQTGLWAQYDPTELATPEAFRRTPKLVWDWYAWRRALVSKAAPNPGHRALVNLESHITPRGSRFTLITQNVDGLHQRAGSQNIIELHGNLHRTKCSEEHVVIESWTPTDAVPPRCPRCGAMLRPDVVWFNEALPSEALRASREATRNCDVLFSIGTSALVEPAASLPYAAIERGATVIEINPAETPLTPFVDYALHGPSGEILPVLLNAAWPLA